MTEKGKILGFDYEAEVPVSKARGARSEVDWLGTVKAFHNAYLKDNSKDSAEIKLEGIVKAGTASVNLRDAIKEAKLKGKVAVTTSSHTEKKTAERGENKGKEIEARIIDSTYLVITEEEKEAQKKKAK